MLSIGQAKVRALGAQAPSPDLSKATALRDDARRAHVQSLGKEIALRLHQAGALAEPQVADAGALAAAFDGLRNMKLEHLANMKAARHAAQGCCKRISSLGSAEVRLAAEPRSPQAALNAFRAAYAIWIAQAPSSQKVAEATDEALAVQGLQAERKAASQDPLATYPISALLAAADHQVAQCEAKVAWQEAIESLLTEMVSEQQALEKNPGERIEALGRADLEWQETKEQLEELKTTVRKQARGSWKAGSPEARLSMESVGRTTPVI